MLEFWKAYKAQITTVIEFTAFLAALSAVIIGGLYVCFVEVM